ncbi:MAG: haloacid dehalogenase type II, partial [Chloroflexota bacterium]|nr:haloacid dehalogenase type II [Chloroflexota bacterium]
MRRIILFDVIETLLDLKALDSQFDRTFGDATARTEWFQQSLQLALVSTVTGAYSDFTSVGKAALEMTAQRRSVALSDEDATLIIGGVRDLPAHPDVREALQRLQYAGLRLAALTNSTQDVAEAQLG